MGVVMDIDVSTITLFIMVGCLGVSEFAHYTSVKSYDKLIDKLSEANKGYVESLKNLSQKFVNDIGNFEATGYELRKLKDGRVEITFLRPAHETIDADLKENSPTSKDNPQWVFMRKVTLPAWMWTEAVCKATLNLNFDKSETVDGATRNND